MICFDFGFDATCRIDRARCNYGTQSLASSIRIIHCRLMGFLASKRRFNVKLNMVLVVEEVVIKLVEIFVIRSFINRNT